MKSKHRWIIALVLILFVGCGQKTGSTSGTTESSGGQPAGGVQQKGSFASIGPADARKMLETRSDILLVDVRSPEELKEGSIQGAVLIPFFSVMRGQHNLDPAKPLILVCAVGGRSYAAGQMLAARGFREVYNLSGGMSAWKRAGLPVEYPQP